MTARNQDFEIFRGDHARLMFNTEIDNLDQTEIVWKAVSMGKGGDIVIRKEETITVDDFDIIVELLPEDTIDLNGRYRHELRIRDGIGNVSTIAKGKMLVTKTVINFEV